MKRGDVLIVRGAGGAVTKARPCVIVQRDSSLDDPSKVTAPPLSSEITFDRPVRPIVAPSPANGLRKPSQIEVDWIFTEQIDRCGPVIGRLEERTMQQIDQALRRWLDL